MASFTDFLASFDSDDGKRGRQFEHLFATEGNPSTIKYQMKIHGALGSARNAVQERRGECISMQSILTLPR